ncbi:MAG: hypothetical protein ACE5H2_09970 [Terriglobia bacterium]
MQRKLFWTGVVAISLLSSLALPLVAGTLVFFVGSAVWWWVVYRSGVF